MRKMPPPPQISDRVCPSEYWLDRWQLKAGLTPSFEAQLESHLAGCTSCQRRMEQREQSEEGMLMRPDFEEVFARARERWCGPASRQASAAASPAPRSLLQVWLQWGWRGVPWAVVAAIGVVLWFPRFSARQGQPLPLERSAPTPGPPLGSPARRGTQASGRVKKGADAIAMLYYVKGSKQSRYARDQQRLHPGDLIQFVYRLRRPAYVMVVSLNQRGEISSFVPLHQTSSVLTPQRRGAFPPSSALQLDDYLGLERIFMLLAPTPFTLRRVKAALRRGYRQAGRDLHRLTALSGPWQAHTLLIHKHPR